MESRQNLIELLEAFYEKALNDPEIGFFFTQVVPLDLKHHLPLIADFWESVVLGGRGYRKNVMEVHQHIHRLSAIRREHLDRWVQLMTETISERYSGPVAELMKQRARSIATLMDIKLNHNSINPQA